jgi:hypothetical protein
MANARSSTKYAIAAVAAAVSMVLGCGGTYDQEVRGRLMNAGKPAVSVRVRFLSEGPRDSCDESGPEALTDEAGIFTIHKKYRRSVFENVAVVIHPYRLCVERDNRWERVWHITSGPAPRTIDLECKLDRGQPVQCRASWNGQAFGRMENTEAVHR